jgi:hypothetical protein
MCRPAGGVWCPYWGSGAFLGPLMGFGTGGRGSSVKLPFYDVCRHVEGVSGQNDRYAEGVAVAEEGQEVGGARLAHR